MKNCSFSPIMREMKIRTIRDNSSFQQECLLSKSQLTSAGKNRGIGNPCVLSSVVSMHVSTATMENSVESPKIYLGLSIYLQR